MAFYLPELFWKAFDKKVHMPFILYSAVIDDEVEGGTATGILPSGETASGGFMFRRSDDFGQASYKDEYGNEYTKVEFEKRLPFFYHRDLQKWDELPDEVCGVKVDAEMIRDNLQVTRIEPDYLHRPQIDLYPLFEAESIFTGLEYPAEMFRVEERMEFIDAASNSVNEKLSAAFTEKLVQTGFRFPAASIWGNPTTRKPFDEGYFIEDAGGRVFQVKMIKGEPFCRDTGIAPESGIRHIAIREHARREYHGTLITGDGRIHLISCDDFRLITLPVEHYDPDTHSFQLLTDPINRTLIYKDSAEGDRIYCVLTDRDYLALKTYEFPLDRDRVPTAAVMSKLLFPFSIEKASSKSDYVLFNLKLNGLGALAGLLASLAVLVIVRKMQRVRIGDCWVDLIAVALTGLYGLLAATLIVGREPPDPRSA
jgi:hypothetical protein